jgi:hypothetical protein
MTPHIGKPLFDLREGPLSSQSRRLKIAILNNLGMKASRFCELAILCNL